MNGPNIERIKELLRNKEVQARIQACMQDARSKATVTISRAANLFDFTESQLREWERKGLLKSDRPLLSQDGKTSTGHRQFSPEELDKLALIRELLNQNYGISEIPHNIDSIWKQILAEQQGQEALLRSHDVRHVHEVERLPIDLRVDRSDQEVFWRYFVSQVLRLSLLLICEDIPDTIAGLVLPLERGRSSSVTSDPKELSKLGPALVGWLGRNRAFYAFLDTAPSFEFPSDFRVEHLRAGGGATDQEDILVVVQRRAKSLILSAPLVETIRRYVDLLYAYSDRWLPCFDYGMRDWVYQVTDFTAGPDVTDEVLNGLTDMVVALGGKTPDGRDRWSFCNLYMPQDPSLPLQQRNLVIRAHSRQAPLQAGSIVLSVRQPGLTFRAYQSGHIIYRAKVAPRDFIIAFREMEDTTRSAIALPVAGGDGLAVASLYIASDEVDAFSLEDQRALRLISRMIEELLATYQARQQVAGKFADLLTDPGLVDISFREFLSEGDFINDLEALLAEIHAREMTEHLAKEEVSFITVDIDNQSILALKLGDRVARNLSRAIGRRIQGQLRMSSDPELRRVYHVSADRYYLLLKGVSLDEARSRAAALHKVLVGEYRFDAQRVGMARPMPPEGLLELPEVTVRLGVSSYKYKKLKEVLGRYDIETAVAEVRLLILQNLDESLERGQREGGDCIISWDNDIWGYRRWSPSEAG